MIQSDPVTDDLGRNRVSAVTQYALAAIDKRDLAGAARGGREAGIVGEITQGGRHPRS